jgi:hypothetical protein
MMNLRDEAKEAFIAGWQAAEDWRKLPVALPQQVEDAYEEWVRESSKTSDG